MLFYLFSWINLDSHVEIYKRISQLYGAPETKMSKICPCRILAHPIMLQPTLPIMSLGNNYYTELVFPPILVVSLLHKTTILLNGKFHLWFSLVHFIFYFSLFKFIYMFYLLWSTESLHNCEWNFEILNMEHPNY